MGRHLKRRRKTWYFQLDVPSHLQSHYGKKRIEETLGTRDEKLAEAKAKKRAGELKLEFMALEGSPEACELLARAEYRKNSKAVERGALDVADAPEGDPAGFGAELAMDAIIEKRGRKFDEDGDPILSDIERAEVEGLIDGLLKRSGKEPKHRDRYEPSFKELAEEWIKSWENSRDRRPSNTASQYRSGIRVFSDYWGDRPIREVTEPDAAQFVELLKKLPPSYGRGRLTGMTLQQSIELTEGEPSGLATSTIKRHMVVLAQIWDWAKSHGRCAGDNPFRIRLPRAKKKGFLHWEPQDLEKLFQHRPKRDDVVEVFVAALYTGMRLGELCELTWAGMREERGIPYIHIDDGKTEAARRNVPLHSELSWLLKRRTNDEELVFPTFTPEGPRKTGTNDASKLFGVWKRSAGFTSRRLGLHSARKNFVSQLRGRGVAQSDVALLVGHEAGFTFDTYDTIPQTLERMRGIVELIEYPALGFAGR